PYYVEDEHGIAKKSKTGKDLRNLRGMQLEQLGKGDFLLFVASLAPPPPPPSGYGDRKLVRFQCQVHHRAKYVIGFLEVLGTYHVVRKNGENEKQPRPINQHSVSVDEDILDRIERSAHCRYLEANFVCTVGATGNRRSSILEHCI